YDVVGRTITEKRIILGVMQTISYVYNLNRSIATITYPSTKQIAYTMSNAQRLLTAKNPASNNPQFALLASYAPIGALQSTVTGQINSGFNGVTESHTFNQSLEYTRTQATSTADTAMDLNFNFATSDNNGS